AIMPLGEPSTAAAGLVLGVLGHVSGWPIPRGGSQRIADALAGVLRSHGGVIQTDSRVTSLPDADVIMCDTSPRELLAIAGDRLPPGYRRAMQRYRYGAGVFKMDWALDGPIPWRAPECARAATVHVGGTFEEIADWERSYIGRPFVLVAQSSLFD